MLASKQYFAGESTERIGDSLSKRLDILIRDTNRTPAKEWRKAYQHYYGKEHGYGVTYAATRGGAQGELMRIRINKSRALAKAKLALLLNAKMSWRVSARHGDPNSTRAIRLGGSILEDAWKSQGLEQLVAEWVEISQMGPGAWMLGLWDPTIGPPLMAIGETLIRQGDIRYVPLCPWDVFHDSGAKSWRALRWYFTFTLENRHDLAAYYARRRLKLADGKQGEDAAAAILNEKSPYAIRDGEVWDQDVIPRFYFIHEPTPALPKGRWVSFLSGKTVLEDLNLLPHYPLNPLHRLALDECFDTPYAWSSYLDTLGAQEMLDGLETSMSSITDTYGKPAVATEQGTEFDESTAVDGFFTWRFPRGAKPPSLVQLADFPETLPKRVEEVSAAQQQLMGLNDIALGQPKSAQMNAQAFALLASQAIQQASPEQMRIVSAVKRLGLATLKLYAQRATRERVLRIGGEDAHYFLEERWTGKELKPIEDADVDIGDPMAQSPQGRLLIAQQLLSIPKLAEQLSPERVLEVMRTGKLEPLIKGAEDEQILIDQENEALKQGQLPNCLQWQNHVLHYRMNTGVLHDKEAQKNPDVIQAVTAHAAEHYGQLWGLPPGAPPESDPLYLARRAWMLGYGPPPPPPGMMGPPPGVAPPGDAPANENSEAPPLPQNGVQPVQMPDNPLTGQSFESNTGGGQVAPPSA